MLQDIRSNIQGTAAKIIIGLIVISFSIFGIESILLGGGSNSVAEVNGEAISPQEVQQVVQTRQRQLLQMMGDNIDPSLLDDQRLQAEAIQSLIQQRVLIQAAQGEKMVVPEPVLGEIIASMPQFQINGQFSPEAYRSVLASNGYSPAMFKQSLANDLLVNQLRSGIAGSDFVTPGEMALSARFNAEQRDLRYLIIPMDEYLVDDSVSEGDVAAYYEAQADEFMTAESVDVTYLELTPEAFFVPVSEDDLQAEYELAIQDYQYATERRVSHILFEPRDGESDEDLNARVAVVQTALAAGEAFEELAKVHSDDIGSASFGGDLGYTTGDAFPEAMEEAIEVLEVDVVSEAIETEAGLHLVKVTEVREGSAPALAEMREQLERQVQERQAAGELVSAVERLRDLSFNAEDLAGPAGTMELELQQRDGITRDTSDELFSNALVQAALYSDDVLQGGHNSEVIELSGDHYVVLRIRQHNTPERLPLESVAAEIESRIALERAREGVSSAAQSALEKLRAGEGVEAVATAAGYEWQVELGAGRSSLSVPRSVLNRAFRLPTPAAGESEFDFVIDAAGDALVFEVAKVTPGELAVMPEAARNGLRRQLGVEHSRLLDIEHLSALQSRADIDVL